MNWLIAEDETDIRNLVVIMAQAWGHSAIAFETGQKAWDWLDEVEAGRFNGNLPEFALMDIRMPGKRGDEVAQRIRSIPALQHIPIVLMTAFILTEDDRSKMIQESGVDFIINKPLPDFEKLRHTLHDIIEKKKAATSKGS